MKHILITGATGFVGRQVTRALSKENVRLTLVVRKTEKCNKLLSYNPEVQLVETQNIFAESSQWWASNLKDVDVVIHLAWHVVPEEYQESSKNFDCLVGSLNLAKAVLDSAVSKFVGVGTCAEYKPQPDRKLVPGDPLEPTTLYAAAKTSLFYCLREAFKNSSTQFSWCRLFYLYGEGEDERRLVPYITNRLMKNEEVGLTSGRQVRDFIDVRQAGEQIAEISIRDAGGVYNICTGVGVSVKDLAEGIAARVNKQHLLKFGVRPDNPFDPVYMVGQVDPKKVTG